MPVLGSVADLNISEPGVCLVSSSEARKAVAELKGAHPLAILSPANIENRGQELHVLVEDASGRCVIRRRFLLQLGVGDVTYMDGKPKKTFKPDSIKVVLSFTKHHTDAETLAFASKQPRESIKKWLELRAKISFLDINNPTRPAGTTDSLQAIVYMSAISLIPALRASGLDGVFVRPFIESDQDRLLYRAAPLPIGVSLETSVRQAAFFGEKAYGVVPYARGFGIRVKAADFQEILTQIQPENSEQFFGKRWEISGLPLAMGKESLQDFLSGWPVTPLHTFRHGFRRTWIVRSAANPVENIIAHDWGVAVIKDAVAKRHTVATERFQAPPRAASSFVREQATNYPKSWVGVVSGAQNQKTEAIPKRVSADGAVAASTISSSPVVAPIRAPPAGPASVAHPVVQSSLPVVNPTDLANLMAASIEAALRPLRERLEATIIPMQRTIESLQAEFVAMREDSAAGDDAMLDATASETALAKRVNDTDRAQTRATRLKITSGL